MLKGAVTSMVMTGANILREGASQAVLELNFDPAQMFTYTNVITNSMMPLVYISAGFSLGFTIIYSLKNAFGGH
ncbi:unknown [Firmicutes bacterium CAG:882]|nr:unknown [Firmicutes bacterium CAG:882]